MPAHKIIISDRAYLDSDAVILVPFDEWTEQNNIIQRLQQALDLYECPNKITLDPELEQAELRAARMEEVLRVIASGILPDGDHVPVAVVLYAEAALAGEESDVSEVSVSEHRWSGWPGAWCLDCGVADAKETCLVLGHPDNCSECVNLPCSEPGSNQHNPWKPE